MCPTRSTRVLTTISLTQPSSGSKPVQHQPQDPGHPLVAGLTVAGHRVGEHGGQVRMRPVLRGGHQQ